MSQVASGGVAPRGRVGIQQINQVPRLGGDVGRIVEVLDGKLNGEGADLVDGEGGTRDEELAVVGVAFGFVGGIE